MEHKDEKSIYNKIGFLGLLNVVWNSTPLLDNILLPYNLAVYHNILKRSSKLEQVLDRHTSKYKHSLLFRLCRPRYHEARELLIKYGIE